MAALPGLNKEELEFFSFFSFFFPLFLLFLGTSGRHRQALVEGELRLPLFFFSFNATFFFFPSLLLPICFLVLVRKFVLFCFVVFASLVNANPKRNKDL